VHASEEEDTEVWKRCLNAVMVV